jgi:hypothetical protein
MIFLRGSDVYLENDVVAVQYAMLANEAAISVNFITKITALMIKIGISIIFSSKKKNK